ncbi:MAG: hypothetical protein ACXVI3_03135 [Halobacteriota archaeon]
MLQDLVEVDDLIGELNEHVHGDVGQTVEKLMKKCSCSQEAFQYLQHRTDDVTLSERTRTHIHLITAKVRSWIALHQHYGWREPMYNA